MKVVLLAMADYASTAGGKLNALGIFRVVLARAFPTQLATLSVMIAFESTIDEAKSGHRFLVRIVDPDDQRIMQTTLETDAEASEPDDGDTVQVLQVAFNVTGFPLMKEGWHKTQVLTVDGSILAETTFRVKLVGNHGT